MIVTCHSKMFESSTRPAENPSTGFLVSSAYYIAVVTILKNRTFKKFFATYLLIVYSV